MEERVGDTHKYNLNMPDKRTKIERDIRIEEFRRGI